ncbi:hypothetical protein [Arthrobacter sp. M4]|uniref:hypothetical protein n=1 Tax=Arthrobacter sp. M4 TaxID=218160 RepID=UPI001CDC3993|nr:hypothetical protein [Arthrobacter sp. M4]MCA4132940.1 hypothetical protein [Arthrobacter sp. M4]
MSNKNRATLLFCMPSFVSGAAQVFDLTGDGVCIYNVSSTPEAADERATFQDWAAVGDDLVAAYGAAAL